MTWGEGGCACGAVEYALTAAPLFVHCCHCRECQRQSGAAFVVNALIETDRIVLTAGEIAAVEVPTASGFPHDIHRCNRCWSPLWSDYGRRPQLRFVRACTLHDPAQVRPDVHIYTRSKLPWIALPPEVPAFTEYYDMKALWPAASLQRFSALAL